MSRIFWRPSTPDWFEETDGRRVRHMIVKRCCNGCQRELGDATEVELDTAVNGWPLPDVRVECGCWTTREIDRLLFERDRARAICVRMEQELAQVNTYLAEFASDALLMDMDGAIELNAWPAADALVDWVGRDVL